MSSWKNSAPINSVSGRSVNPAVPVDAAWHDVGWLFWPDAATWEVPGTGTAERRRTVHAVPPSLTILPADLKRLSQAAFTTATRIVCTLVMSVCDA